MQINWKSSSAYLEGVSHGKANIPCQDHALHRMSDGVHVIVLADGAGSCKLSHIGAETISTNISAFLCNSFDELYMEESTEEIAQKLKVITDQALEELAVKHQEHREVFSSTLLFVAVKEQKFLAGHVGDGIIGQYSEGTVSVLSHPENGKFANETYFVTAENLIEHFRIYKGDVNEKSGFVLMSDGASASFYLQKDRQLDPTNIEIIFEHMQDENLDTFKSDLIQLLTFLKENTDDDCSIALLKATGLTEELNLSAETPCNDGKCEKTEVVSNSELEENNVSIQVKKDDSNEQVASRSLDGTSAVSNTLRSDSDSYKEQSENIDVQNCSEENIGLSNQYTKVVKEESVTCDCVGKQILDKPIMRKKGKKVFIKRWILKKTMNIKAFIVSRF
ncbi:protein phosphatase 2C domain-containing protein [Priestia aryabhattai]|uniref:PP2C family serine/threonine-protein phosphatase n=1 Tax=Priestia aryabhattai TaxID=412384 RepID=UPI00211C1377|nr:PP2C family serine/threonine-protein phosphatase [Priestia aryabhattai]MCQ9281104.1 protein phosphatase 2C domain-containing protein [Priestia aryabhattai]